MIVFTFYVKNKFYLINQVSFYAQLLFQQVLLFFNFFLFLLTKLQKLLWKQLFSKTRGCNENCVFFEFFFQKFVSHFLLQKDSPRVFFEKLILQGNFEVILMLWKTFRFSFICFAVKTAQVGNNCFLKKGHCTKNKPLGGKWKLFLWTILMQVEVVDCF